MNLLERAGAAWRVLTGAEQRSGGTCATVPYGFEPYLSGSGDFAFNARDGYQLNCIVFAACWKVMQGCALVPLKLAFDGKPIEDGKLPAFLDPVNELLHRPNPQSGYRAFVQRWWLHTALAGNSYSEIIGAGTEDVGSRKRALAKPELWLMRPSQVRLNRANANAREPSSYTDTARRLTFQPEEIVHWRLPNPTDDLLGQPLLEAATVLIDSSNNAFTWNASLFQNMAVPAGVLFLKELRNMTEAEQKKVIRDFEKRFGGTVNAGKTFVTAAETADYKQLAQSAKDLDWGSGLRELMRFLSALIGCPSQMLGDPGASTYANYSEARSSFFLETVLPWMEFFADELTHKLLPVYGEGLSFALDTTRVNSLITDVQKVRASLAVAEWMTDDERRAEDPAELQPLGGDAAKLKAPQPGLAALLTGTKESKDVKALEDQAAKDAKKEPRGLNMKYGPLDLRGDSLPYVARGSLYPTLELRNDAVEKFDRRRRKWEAKWKPELVDYFDGQKPKVLKALAFYSSAQQALQYIGAEDQFIATFEPLVIGLTVDFGQAALDELQQEGIEFDIDRPGLKGRIMAELAEQARYVNQSTAYRIREVLEQAAVEGVGADEQARRIRELYADMSRSRAVTIARTETGRASTRATIEGYKQSGVVNYKEWVSARDNNVRDSHVEADGQVVPLEGSFSLGGTQTEGPGLSGDPGEDINCRCRIAPLREPDQAI